MKVIMIRTNVAKVMVSYPTAIDNKMSKKKKKQCI